jgi:hypothetical protein|tara:strand:+ start:1432 stop:1755 length:324 start_codon:yes stop_codon:yes gene_type:complete
MVVEEILLVIVILLYIGFEFGVVYSANKIFKRDKVKTDRHAMPWISMPTIGKAMVIILCSIMLVFFFWLYNYSILGPEPGELYNLEIVLVGLGFALTMFTSLWMIRN